MARWAMSSTWTGSSPASARSAARAGSRPHSSVELVPLVPAAQPQRHRSRRRSASAGAPIWISGTSTGRGRSSGVLTVTCSLGVVGDGCAGGKSRCSRCGVTTQRTGRAARRTTRWRRQSASSRSGRSSRQWQPRVSSRRRAAATRTRATHRRLVSPRTRRRARRSCRTLVTLSSLHGVAVDARRALRPPSSGSAAERSTPAPSDMIRWISPRASGAISGSSDGLVGARRAHRRRAVAREAMSAAMRSAKTRPSSSELEASRFAPWTPVQATSPQAYRPGTVVRPRRSVRTPPEA